MNVTSQIENSTAICCAAATSEFPSRAATYSVVWRHSASNRRMDRKSGHGSMRVGTGSPRDRDGAYGEVFIRRLRPIGIRDGSTSPRFPWQNAHAESLIGSIPRECLDHVVVSGERHLRHILLSYMSYHNEIRTHYLWRKMRRSRAPSK
jgi:hypothetical protein